MGKRVGTKRKDKRWEASDGSIWASEFEYRVFSGLRDVLGADVVRRCEPGEDCSFDYTTPTREGVCMECGSGEVVQRRTYTPDIYVIREGDKSRRTFIETKGYFPAEKRSLLSHFSKTGPGINLIVILQTDSRATRSRSLSEWIWSFCKYRSFVWNPCKKPTKNFSLENIRTPPDELIAFLL